MPWTEGSRLALSTCSCVQWSHSPSLYSGIPSLSCSLSHLPTSQCTHTYNMSLLRHQQQATDSRTAGPPRCLTGQGHHHAGRLELHALWQFLHLHRSWPHCLMLIDVSSCSHAAANMPEQQEGHSPAEGDPPKQQRSRFRSDGRSRRTSGEIAKRAPHAQHWKDIQARQRQREHERASSSHQKQAHEPQHFRIHTDEDQEDQKEPDDDGPWRGEEDNGAWDGWHDDQWEDESHWNWQDYDEDDWTRCRNSGAAIHA